MTSRFQIEFSNRDAEKEYRSLTGKQRVLVDKGLARLSVRPEEIGKPLSGALKGCCELKFRADGIRIIYEVEKGEVKIVEIIAIGKRDKDEVFKVAEKRR